jgi:Phage integrase family.
MARCELITFTPHAPEVVDGKFHWVPLKSGGFEGLPQICWESGEPWREANLWLLNGAYRQDIETVRSNAKALHAYAQWLESSDPLIHWWDFPAKEKDRCLVRFRGFLIKKREAGQLAPSTASARMRAVIRFYRWAYAERLFTLQWPMWHERQVVIKLDSTDYLERTVVAMTTNLAIPNRKRNATALEDGVMPVSAEERDAILTLVDTHGSVELALMLRLGFFTGMRLGTICDLKVDTLIQAIPEPGVPDARLISIGPNARPPVHTKGGTYGHITVPRPLIEDLTHYASSLRRLERQTRAKRDDKSLLFLTRFGNPYVKRKANKSAAINVEMHKLRSITRAEGTHLSHFHFHMTRATFACDVMRLALQIEGIDPVAVVGAMLFHTHRRTTEAYVHYLKTQPIKADVANAFTKVFLGAMKRPAEKDMRV